MITIQDFKNEASFLYLQNKFEKMSYLENLLDFGIPLLDEIQKVDFYIETQVPDEFSFEGHLLSTKLEKSWFYKDFLHSRLYDLFENYKRTTINHINTFCLGDINVRKNFILFQRQEVSKILLNLNQFDFLRTDLFKILRSQIIQSEKFINSDTLLTDKIFGIGKIEFLTNEQDLITLLYFLRKNKFINNYTDSQLGRLIESNFCVKLDDEKSKDLERVGKRLNDLKNGNDSVDKSVNRLQKAFKNEDFFDI